MRKIGIIGGTFNPIHNGHIALAKTAYNELSLDEVIFISSGMSYFKKDIVMPSREDRFNMTNLAVSDVPYFSASDIEMKREGNSYTFETILELKKIYNDAEFFYIIGADTLFSMESWKNPEIIFENCNIVCAVRDDIDINELKDKSIDIENKYKTHVIILNFNKIQLSSSEIRKMLSNNEDVSHLIPAGVLNYIKENKLY
ncbi:MAG: nicotinate-nucleotide adenylyltransferase [Lachnospiraceae bacterium]|nr:nicotinate-nucleotide adenylyltransferase [Lachnospiraceae bacterium]